MHFLIPFAASDSPACRAALKNLALPCLTRLLRLLEVLAPDLGDQHSLTPPHERALARAHAVPDTDGRVPWAAWQVAQDPTQPPNNDAWAWVTPCHFTVQSDTITLNDPAALQLGLDEAQALVAAMQPFWAEDGLQLSAAEPQRWLARGPWFADLASASLDRVVGRDLSQWLPSGSFALALRRLMSEMQMLLYQHPLFDARLQRGQTPVNALWVSGCGAWPAARTAQRAADLQVDARLRQPALDDDAKAWVNAWQALDAGPLQQMLQAQQRGADVTLTLCGERAAQRLVSGGSPSVWQRFHRLFERQRASHLLEQL